MNSGKVCLNQMAHNRCLVKYWN